ncbi:NRAMP (natural resistance-associated macrophage protein)-like metal ion transporter [Chitinophaga niastensis]|uniref:NRAMP (Natural resistance-associated macrophage protein)-like metal ion transporter n=1 Tax=Chitinophaga niastensis TaxID=536980 RepID=A0A2P8HQ34_CHINA|nr:divalent metal cation transporter [Chitinophaga niastensis]PSL48350.1 NRAMP (natural resistance-associated macrophage protein)-like metal ion transporter [Chitinophaga niastensis]
MKKEVPIEQKGFRRFLSKLGPGLITGASDDDPSGITTYSQAGAQFGFATLWTAVITFPLMVAVQEMCARIGAITSMGLTGTLKKHYPRWILWVIVITSFPAIILNIGADIAGMGAVSNLIFPRIPAFVFTIGFTIFITVSMIFFSYQQIASILKYTCIVLLAYLIVPFITKTSWNKVAVSIFLPHISFSKDYIEMLVAFLGTTISPYLFFWQATMEAEDIKHQRRRVVVNKQLLTDVRQDVTAGIFCSNLVMMFIIITCGNVLFSHGTTKITTVEQAASALKPLAGAFSYWLFAIGIIGTGMLAIPVLCGSLSYMFAETFNWKEGLDKKFSQAKPFYGIIVLSLGVGLAINYVGVSPVQGLFYTAVLYGLTAPLMISVILHICNNRRIMGKYVNKRWSNILGGIAFIFMTVAAVFLLYLQFMT